MHIFRLIICSVLLMLTWTVQSRAEDKATPREVIQQVQDAARFLSTAGEGGLTEFMNRSGRWVWKDTYVFVMRCDQMTVVAHPVNPNLVGKNHAGVKDVKGSYFMVQYCDAAKKPQGSWVELWYPKIGERQPSRKLNYVLQVPNTPYQVGAGVYDDTISLTELSRIIR